MRRVLAIPVFLLFLAWLESSCSRSSFVRPRHLAPGRHSGLTPAGPQFQGKASWYSVATNGGRTTASGEPLSDSTPTAAHRSLPFGTWVKVTNLNNGQSETARITDRGPFIRGRVIDVSRSVGDKLGMIRSGVVPVRVEVMVPANSE